MAKKNKPLIIDAHGHVKWYGYDADRLVENMDQHGIDVMWLLSWEVPQEEIDAGMYDRVFWPGRFGMPLEDIVEAVKLHPTRFVLRRIEMPRDDGRPSRSRTLPLLRRKQTARRLPC
jgi:hypothetical protein